MSCDLCIVESVVDHIISLHCIPGRCKQLLAFQRGHVSLPVWLRGRQHEHNRLRWWLLLNYTNQPLLPTACARHAHARKDHTTGCNTGDLRGATGLNSLDYRIILRLCSSQQHTGKDKHICQQCAQQEQQRSSL